uniref:Chitin-binding type-2 domain-containing protein n=1 Tax=Anopheles culicifacies TaxID=139723 RepID=A0A182MSQ3_9DIPT
MASSGGSWSVVCRLGILLLVSGWCVSEPQPANLCQPRCWGSEREERLRWPASASINQYWECLADGGEWYARLRLCPLGGMWFDAANQQCVMNIAGSSVQEPMCGRRYPTGGQQLADGNELCPYPSCASQERIETLWGYPDPAYFLQCRPVPDGSWQLQLMPCAPGTWFHYREQVCLIPELWEACDGTEGGDSGTTTPVITIPVITTPILTTPQVTTPEITTPEITTLEITTPEVTTPEVTTPEVTTTEITTVEITTVSIPEPGTDDSIVLPTNPCSGPRCVTLQEINTLWIHPMPTMFYQCRPLMGGWSPQEMPCAPGTLFSYFDQVCVHTQDWVDICGDDSTLDPPVSTTVQPPVTITVEPPVTITVEPPVTITVEPPVTTTTVLPPVTITVEPPVTTTTEPGQPPSIIDCLVPNCILLQDEVIRLPSNDGPQYFYRCIFLLQIVWIPFQDICPAGKYFNFANQACVDPSEWIDVCPSDPVVTTQMTTVSPTPTMVSPSEPLPVVCGSPRCITPEERSILWPSTVADMYYRCEWIERLFQFVPIPVRCDNFFFFDFMEQKCVNPLDWVDICPIYPTLPPPTCPDCCPTCPPGTEEPADPELPLPIICGVPRCVTEQERNFQWPALNPNEYYRCVDNGDGWVQATLQRCPEGELFQTLEQRCVPANEHDNSVCPIYPPPPVPPTTEQPDPDTCLEDFDPQPFLPIICDIARCNTEMERSVLWPLNDPTRYLVCQLQEETGQYVPVQNECSAGQSFDFFAQCCRVEPQVGVCPVYPPLNTAPPTPEQPVCLTDAFDPSPLIPIDCDVPRCSSVLERSTRWPSTDPDKYYQCIEQTAGLYEPILLTCESPTSFNFFLQCCTEETQPLDVCGLLVEPLPDPTTLPLPIVCDEPRCSTDLERNFIWPAADRKLLYLCEPEAPIVGSNEMSFSARMYTCADGKVFHPWRQDCVPENECRLNVCPFFNGTVTNGSTTTTTAATPGMGVGPILTPPSIG